MTIGATGATGERFIPELMGGQLIEAEHVVRYLLAAQLARGRRVLDAGCGVGWGTGLLVAAGASTATGLDLDVDAIADARQRVPAAQFVVGDLARLPWETGSFDLVVCLEVLEHVAKQELALDELARVLAADGLLLVSSPNPRVYPAGNPFHLRELAPEELEQAVGERLSNVVQWNQHTQIASILVRRGGLPPGETREVLARAVAPLGPGSDPYSLIIAGRGSLPSLPPLVACAPSDQLLHLEAIAAGLSEERERMSGDQARVAVEREQVLAERSRLLLELDEQKTKLRAWSEDHGRVVAEREQILAERSRLLLESEEHRTSLRALGDRMASLERQVEASRRQREHTAALLLESEQQLAEVLASTLGQEHVEAQLAEQVAHLAEEAAHLHHQVAVFRTSRSWRFTAPLRAARRRLLPKR